MIRSILSKVAWLGRTASIVFGLALVLALMFGVASMAFAQNGQSFVLGSLKNGATAMSRLTMTGTANGSVLQLIQQSTGTGASGLGITVPTGKAPIKVNSAAGKATNLSADKLDGMDSSAFAPANHNHDSSYIQQSPTSAENASIYIDGTMRTSGMLRTGSETGTSNPPQLLGGPVYDGLVVRHINSTSADAGQVLARTDQLRLERDGTTSGLRIAWDPSSSTRNTVDCMGINSAGASVNRYIAPVVTPDSGGTAQVYTDAQNVVYATCSFGDSYNNRHVTQVILQHFPGDSYWVGTVISTFNQ